MNYEHDHFYFLYDSLTFILETWNEWCWCQNPRETPQLCDSENKPHLFSGSYSYWLTGTTNSSFTVSPFVPWPACTFHEIQLHITIKGITWFYFLSGKRVIIFSPLALNFHSVTFDKAFPLFKWKDPIKKKQLWHGVPFMCAFFWFHWCSKFHKR